MSRNQAERLLFYAIAFVFAAVAMAATAHHWLELAEAKKHMDAGDWQAVQQKMEDLAGEQFCYQLMTGHGYIDMAISARERHDALAHFYNRRIDQDGPGRIHEPPLPEGTPTREALNGLIFTAHIDPWMYCAREKGIHNQG